MYVCMHWIKDSHGNVQEAADNLRSQLIVGYSAITPALR